MDPKGKRVVLADHVLAPLHAKHALARCLLEDLQVRGRVSPLPTPAAPALT
jgi:hypothetical protein